MCVKAELLLKVDHIRNTRQFLHRLTNANLGFFMSHILVLVLALYTRRR